MILVTVGTHETGFERLVRSGDELAALIEEEVVIQRGHTPYLPSHARSFEWVTGQELEAWMTRARVVVTHAGAGTLLQALKLGRPLVIVPRLRKFSEIHLDHQKQLALALARQGRAVVLEEVSGATLRQAVEQAASCLSISSIAPSLVPALRARLESWKKEKKR